MKRVGIVVIALLVAGLWVSAAAKDQYATINFEVLKDENGKPIRNAAVILHPVSKSGKQHTSGQELKTDKDGKASIDYVPYGVWRVQVIANGRQTYGQDFTVDQPQHEIKIKLKPPQEQYSIYGNDKKDDKK